MSFAKSRSPTEFNSAASVAMSILNYFRREKRQQGEFLPSPSDFSSDLSSSVRAANVRNASSKPPATKRRKVGEHHNYSPKNYASIGHYTALHGLKRATLMC